MSKEGKLRGNRKIKKLVLVTILVLLLLLVGRPAVLPGQVVAESQIVIENPKRVYAGIVDGFDISKSGRKLVFYTMHSNELKIMDLENFTIYSIFLPDSLRVYREVRWGANDEYVFFNAMGNINGTSDQNVGLWKVKIDGSDLSLIKIDVGFFALSPDGAKVAYTPEYSFGDGGFHELWVMNIDGTDSHKIASMGPTIYSIDWSPDGENIAFVRIGETEQPLAYEIWTIKTDGSELKRVLVNYTLPLWQLSWSPDGTKLAYCTSATNSQPTGGIWLIDADGTNKVRLTITDKGHWQPRWFPDGNKIAYYMRGASPGIYILDLLLMETGMDCYGSMKLAFMERIPRGPIRMVMV